MGVWADFLKTLNPITGKRITDRGTSVNIADIAERFDGSLDVFGQLASVEYTPILERKPLPGVSFIRDRVMGDGVVDTINGETRIDATLGPTALYTRDFGRYLPGIIGLAGIGVRIPDFSTGHYEYGYGNGAGNRMGLEWDNGEPFTFIESGGNRYYRKPRSEWIDPLDGTGPSGIDAGLTTHVLRMPFGWYGYLSVVWVIAINDPGTGKDRLVTIDISGQKTDGVNIEQPDLPIFAEADGGIMYVGGRQYGVYGRYNPKFRTTSSPSTRKTVSNTLEPIVTLRIKDETRFRGVPAMMSGASILSSENVEWAIIIGAELTGASFGDIPLIDPEETALEMDTSATAFTGGYRAYTNNSTGGQGNRLAAEDSDLPDISMPRDLSVTLCARRIGDGSAVIDAVLRAREET